MSILCSQLEKCLACKAECCRYLAIPFENPKTKREFDEVRWYLLHENTWVYIDDDGDWNVEFRTRCKNLAADNTCDDYENRPRICREYPDNGDTCENDGEGSPYKELFKTRDDLEAYLQRQKEKRRKKKNKE